MKNTLLILALVVSSSISYGQDSVKTSNFYLNYKVYDELTVGYERHLNKKISISLDIGYNIGGATEVVEYNGSPVYPSFIYRRWADYGPSSSIMVNANFRENQALSIEYRYRYLTSNDLIYAPSIWSGGGNVLTYSHHDLISSESLIFLNYSIVVSKRITAYIGIGRRFSKKTKTYSILGTYENHGPSDRVDVDNEKMLVLKTGLKLYLSKK